MNERGWQEERCEYVRSSSRSSDDNNNTNTEYIIKTNLRTVSNIPIVFMIASRMYPVRSGHLA